MVWIRKNSMFLLMMLWGIVTAFLGFGIRDAIYWVGLLFIAVSCVVNSSKNL